MSGFERYLAIESAGGPSWHPEKSKIVFTFNAPGTYQIFSVEIMRGHSLWPRRLSYEEDRCTAPKYLSDGSLIFMKDAGGDENFQIGCVKEDDNLIWLTSNPSVKHIIDIVTDSGFFFNANIEDRSRRDPYKLKNPVDQNEPELIHRSDRGVMRVDCASQDEKQLILERFLGNNQQELLLYESGSVTSLTEGLSDDDKIRWRAERVIGPDTLLVNTDYKSDYRRLALLNFAGELKAIPEIEKGLRYDTVETVWTAKSPDTFFFNNEEGYSSLHCGSFRPDGACKIRRVNLPLKGTAVVGDERTFDASTAVSPDGNLLAVTLASPTKPLNIWIIDTETCDSWMATDVGLAGLNPNGFSETTLHWFNSFDGLSVPFFRYYPRGTPPERGWPCILMIHGGPESQFKPDLNPLIQFFTSAGVALVAPNIRGSDGYGRRYLDMDNVEKRLDSIVDIRYLAIELRDKRHNIDPERLVVYGGSYGGFAVLSSMTEHPDLWRAGVDLFGISNFVTFLQNTASWRRPLREAEYGSLQGDREVLERISPINRVDRIKAPLFIIQGDRDERVPLSESLQIYESVKSRGIPAKMIRFPDEGHGIAKLENRITAYAELLEWLRQNVLL